MNKIKLLSTVAMGVMLISSLGYAANIDEAAEEEVAAAVANVLRKNPKIAYDAVVKYRAEMAANQAKEDSEGKLTPLEEKVAAILKDNPQLVITALQIYDQELQQKELLKTAEEYKKHSEEINAADIYVGNPNGQLVLVEFFDFSCGFCKQMAPRLKNIIEKNSDLKVIFKPVAFLSPTSEIAAKAAIAANNQGKFLEMYTRLMAEVRVNEPAIEKIAKELGLDMERYQKDFKSKETADLLTKIKNTADKINLKSVPTLILNGMPLYAVEEAQIDHALEVMRKELR